ncbi:hypothetical protein INR49_012292 [Caranx melampygus]|nr:hypothetical protein INR49_012292 [Caranx melampygus]
MFKKKNPPLRLKRENHLTAHPPNLAFVSTITLSDPNLLFWLGEGGGGKRLRSEALLGGCTQRVIVPLWVSKALVARGRHVACDPLLEKLLSMSLWARAENQRGTPERGSVEGTGGGAAPPALRR